MLQHLMDYLSGSHLIALVNADPLWVVTAVIRPAQQEES